eukprot:gene8754-18103_t
MASFRLSALSMECIYMFISCQRRSPYGIGLAQISRLSPCPWNENTCTTAASAGNLNVLKWLRSQDPPCPWNEQACIEALWRNYPDMLKWIISKKNPSSSSS